jgi:hypothetical protein
MKTNKHHQLFASLAASLMFLAAGHLRGAVNTFTDRAAWETAVFATGGSLTIFGFNFFPPLTYPAAISNQFSNAGFEFLASDGRFPTPIDYGTNGGVLSTPSLPNTGQTIRWRFTTPIRAVGWERGNDDDTHIYRIFDANNVQIGMIDFRTPTKLGGPVFGGFITDVPIGFVESFSDNNDQLHAIDNLRYASIAPSRWRGSTWLAASDFVSFGGAADGWRASNSANTINPRQDFTYTADNGNPGGYISVGETAGTNGILYFDAPAKFLGDKRKAYNGVLTFDLRYSEPDLPDRWFQADDVIIAGTNVTIAYRVFMQFPSTDWSRFEIPLTESVGWIRVGSNRLATAQEIVSALQSIQYLRIRAEWTGHSSYSADLDNVMLLGWPAPTPQPTLAADTYAGITINGAVGHSYRVEYRGAFDAADDWKKLADLILPSSPYLFLDVSSPYASQRFYRAVLNE